MQPALALIGRIANLKSIIMLFILYAVVFGTILVTLGQLAKVSGGYSILDFDQSYSPERVNDVFGSYGDRGMALYARIQLLDLFNPALYSLLLASLTYLMWTPRSPHWLPLFPLLGGLGDYLENATLFLMARAYPDIPEGLVATSSALSLLKTTFLLVALLGFLVALVAWLYSRLRSNAP